MRAVTFIHNWGVTNLLPRVSFNLRELEFLIVGVHFPYLLAGGGAEDFDDFYELIHSAVAWEYWLSQQQLRQYTAGRPYVCNATNTRAI